MTRSGAGEQVAARIGFAEQWLARARGEVSEGQLARGVLTMVLAQAEVHHAMEMAGAPASRRRRPRRVPAIPIVVLFGAAMLVAAAVLGGFRFGLAAAPTAVPPGPPVVRLSAPVGELLHLVILPPPVAPAPAAVEPARRRAGRPTPVRAAPPASGKIRVFSGAPPAPAPVPSASGQAAGSQPAPAAATAPAALPDAEILSAGDLIDLVLIAGTTLRTDSMRR